MTEKVHIEKLHELISDLESDAEFLYRYGHLTCSEEMFLELSERDQNRLTVLALREGSDEAKDVARFLMGKKHHASVDLETIFSTLSLEDQQEIETYGQESQMPFYHHIMTQIDWFRITRELREVCENLGPLAIEEAYWILIPEAACQMANWVHAVGGQNSFYEHVASPYEVGYQPDEDDLYELITQIRHAAWALHVHNHPVIPWSASLCIPSEQDLRFAATWKSRRRELADKMLFFVIQSEMAVEYGREPDRYHRWV